MTTRNVDIYFLYLVGVEGDILISPHTTRKEDINRTKRGALFLAPLSSVCKIRLHALDARAINAHAVPRLNVPLMPRHTFNLHHCLLTVKMIIVYTTSQAGTSDIHHLANVT